MSSLFCSSIGKKMLMGLSGIFLMLFLVIHLLLNSFLLIPDGGEMFNVGAHFMATNPIIAVIEPVLAIVILVHIIYGVILTIQNRKARGTARYASGNKTTGVTWQSKNMFVLGAVILAFLVLHIANFWVKMKLTGDPLLEASTINIAGVPTVVENSYALVNATFSYLLIVIVYVIAGIGLALHLSHGFWSSIHSIGFNNDIWRKRLTVFGNIYAWVVGLGFDSIALFQYLLFQ